MPEKKTRKQRLKAIQDKKKKTPEEEQRLREMQEKARAKLAADEAVKKTPTGNEPASADGVVKKPPTPKPNQRRRRRWKTDSCAPEEEMCSFPGCNQTASPAQLPFQKYPDDPRTTLAHVCFPSTCDEHAPQGNPRCPASTTIPEGTHYSLGVPEADGCKHVTTVKHHFYCNNLRNIHPGEKSFEYEDTCACCKVGGEWVYFMDYGRRYSRLPARLWFPDSEGLGGEIRIKTGRLPFSEGVFYVSATRGGLDLVPSEFTPPSEWVPAIFGWSKENTILTLPGNTTPVPCHDKPPEKW